MNDFDIKAGNRKDVCLKNRLYRKKYNFSKILLENKEYFLYTNRAVT